MASSDRGSTYWSHALVLLQELLVICYKGLRDIDLRSREPFQASTPLFKWHHFTAEVILCAVRWSLQYALSYRDVEELLRERDAEAAERSFRKVLARHIRPCPGDHRGQQRCLSPAFNALQHDGTLVETCT
jgi:hypothetical protein